MQKDVHGLIGFIKDNNIRNIIIACKYPELFLSVNISLDVLQIAIPV